MGHETAHISNQSNCKPRLASTPLLPSRAVDDLSRLIRRINVVACEVSAVLDQIIQQHETNETQVRKLA